MDLANLALAFVAGAVVSIGVAYAIWKRRTADLMRHQGALATRIADLESKVVQQAEDYAKQLGSSAREHGEELERLTRERRLLQDAHQDELRARIREAEERAYEEGKRQAELRADEKAKAFSMVVRPYIRKQRDDGFVKKSNRIEVGYQCQLQINGIPCFAPHVVIEQQYEEKDVNQEVIERMTRLALDVAKTAVAIQAGPAGALIPIMTSPVIEG